MRNPAVLGLIGACCVLSLGVHNAVAGDNSTNIQAKAEAVCGEQLGDTGVARYALPEKFQEFLPFIKPGERLLAVACAMVAGRQGVEYLVATKAPMAVGSVAIVVRGADNVLHVEAMNHTVVQIDGVEGSGEAGRFASISANDGGFSIFNVFGNRCSLDQYEFRFLYSSKNETWQLDSIKTIHWAYDPSLRDRKVKEVESTLTTKDFGQVSFSQFDGRQYGIVESTKARIEAVQSTPAECD